MAQTDGRARRGGHGRWKVKPLALLFLFVSTLAYGEPCEERFARLDAALATAYQQLKAIDQGLLEGTSTPKWRDFDDLDRILRLIRQGKKNVAQAGKDLELKKILDELAAAAKTDPDLVKLGAPRPKLEPGMKYVPTQYELRLLYQRKLQEVNRELPANLRIPIARIPFDRRRALLQAETAALMKSLDERFEKLFPTSGYRNIEELKAAEARAGERAQRVNEVFEKEQIDIVMYRPESARFWVPKVGFHNQHVTGSSRGYLGPARNNTEATMLGLASGDLKAMDNELKPKYGTFMPKPETGFMGTNAAIYYGADLYVFKLDSIRDRLTVTPGDSLNRMSGFNPDYATTVVKPESWDGMFVPWKDRALIAPEFYGAKGIWNVDYNGGRALWNATEAQALSSFKSQVTRNGSGYPEAQIFGPLSLDDVSEFRFIETPPSGDFLHELQKRGIKIIDLKKGRPVP